MQVTQSRFAQALLNPDLPAPEGLIDPMGRPAGRRFDVYRNNVTASLIDALKAGFPIIVKLVGEEFFAAMATVFLRAHPPESPILAQYGTRFPGFLQSFGPVRHLPYLPDMARLELGLRQSYHAADAAALDIRGIAPERVMDLRPRMAPASLVLRSRFPILSIWRVNRFDLREKITMTPQDVLITRMNYDPAPHLLTTGGIDLARHLKGRMSLSDAAMAALASEPQADLAALLHLFFTTSALTLDEGLIP